MHNSWILAAISPLVSWLITFIMVYNNEHPTAAVVANAMISIIASICAPFIVALLLRLPDDKQKPTPFDPKGD